MAVQGAMLTLNLIRDVITDMCYCDTCRPLVRAHQRSTVFCRSLLSTADDSTMAILDFLLR